MTEISTPPVRLGRRRILLLLICAMVLLLMACGGLDLWAGYKLRAQVARPRTRYGSERDTLRLRPVPAADNRARCQSSAALIVPGPDTSKIYPIRREQASPCRLKAPRLRGEQPIRDEPGNKPRNPHTIAVELGDRAARCRQPARLAGDPDAVKRALCHRTSGIEAGRADEAAKAVMSVWRLPRRWDRSGCCAAVDSDRPRHSALQGRREVIVDRNHRSWPSRIRAWLNTRAEGKPDPEQPRRRDEICQRAYSETLLRPASLEISIRCPAMRRLGRRSPRAALRSTVLPPGRVRFLQPAEAHARRSAGPQPRPSSGRAAEPAFWDVPGRLANLPSPGSNARLGKPRQVHQRALRHEIGVALRRYRLDRGSYPDDLSALAPSYPATVPIDPFTGKPPVYARQGAGFTLHAESGKSSAPIRSALDWTVEK